MCTRSAGRGIKMTKIMVNEEEYEALKTKVKEIEKKLHRLIELVACDRLGLPPSVVVTEKIEESK
jgi:predicted dithiol-disulfide oxidoreductase (DUF899 family)